MNQKGMLKKFLFGNKKNIILTLFIIVFFLSFASAFAHGSITSSVTSDKITLLQPDPSFGGFTGEIVKTYEINPSNMDVGYYLNLSEKHSFIVNVESNKYLIILWNVTGDNLTFVLPGGKMIHTSLGQTSFIDLDSDSDTELEILPKSIQGNVVNLFIKEFRDTDVSASPVNFDKLNLLIDLTPKKVYDASTLKANIFVSAKEPAPVKTNIYYSILNSTGDQVYSSEDPLVFESNKSFTKDFTFLHLNPGDYILEISCTCNNNQSKISDTKFYILEKTTWDTLKGFLFFVLVLVGLLFIVFFSRRSHRYKKKKGKKKKKK